MCRRPALALPVVATAISKRAAAKRGMANDCKSGSGPEVMTATCPGKSKRVKIPAFTVESSATSAFSTNAPTAATYEK